MMNNGNKMWAQKQGQAGVYRVASALLLNGLNPSFPAFDEGADLMVNAVRVQVKSARLSTSRAYKAGSYFFYFRNHNRLRTNQLRGRSDPVLHDLSAHCDFVVLWGVESDRFWVVPSKVLRGVHMIAIGHELKLFATKASEVSSYEGRWGLIVEAASGTLISEKVSA